MESSKTFSNPPPEALPPTALEPAQLDELELPALDLLPYGVIGLTREGIVMLYNLAEARLARLDRSQVLGQDFFRRVAPCTATPEFEGRFRSFVAENNTVASVRFGYVFDFRFGAQQVEIELLRSQQAGRYYLLVNRTRFLGVRSLVPGTVVAPAQRELAPDEALQGVQRDEDERRLVRLPPTFLEAMMLTWKRLAPQAWPLFCHEWGLQWGRRAVVEMEVQSLQRSMVSLREQTMDAAMVQLAEQFQFQGLGLLHPDFETASDGLLAVHLDRSAVAEAMGSSEAPRCHLVAGYLEAVFGHLAGRLVAAHEISCRSQGHPLCTFIIAGRQRKTELNQALRLGGDSLQRVRLAWKEQFRGS